MNYGKFETAGSLEQLEEGVFLEQIGVQKEDSEIGETAETGYIFGDLGCGTAEWHFQENPEMREMSLVCFIIHLLTGREVDIHEECDLAAARGLYHPQAGMSKENIRQMLLGHGLEVEQYTDLSMRDTMELLESGGRLLCVVNSWVMDDRHASGLRGLTPDCMVVLSALDVSDPVDIRAHYISVSSESECMKKCSWDLFQRAWMTGNRYAMSVSPGRV